MKNIIVSDIEAGQRLDKLLVKYMNLAPKSFLYKMLRKKNITLNGKKADGSEKISAGDEIKLFLSDETIQKFSKERVMAKSNKPLDIIYEDTHVILLNKPAGILSQKADREDISVVEYLTNYLVATGQIEEERLAFFRPGICNRLDRNTSGLLTAGKTLAGLSEMSALLKERKVDKYYLCLTKGCLKEKKKIEGFLVKSEKNNKVFVSRTPLNESSLKIQTEYEPVKTTGEYTLLRVKLITGRSHQIRAHLSSIGHPVIGDYKYGERKINDVFKKNFGLSHQLLHSCELDFPALQGALTGLSEKKITAPLPEDFKKIEEALFERKGENVCRHGIPGDLEDRLWRN